MHAVCVVELRITVNNIKILCVAQQCLYGEFMSSAKCKVPDATLKQNSVYVLVLSRYFTCKAS